MQEEAGGHPGGRVELSVHTHQHALIHRWLQSPAPPLPLSGLTAGSLVGLQTVDKASSFMHKCKGICS